MTRFYNRIFVCETFAAVAISVAGCGSGQPQGPSVTGMITVSDSQGDTVPLSDGLITWEPIRLTSGPKVSARVQSGRYEFPPESGLCGGQYRIEVMAMPPEIAAAMHGQSVEGPPSSYREIDKRFNSNSTLKHKIIIDVENRFDATVSYRLR